MITIANFFKNNCLVFLTLFIVVCLSYGQTLGMYFWIDDNALIYKLQHINQDIGFWGTGAIGSGPYRHIVNQFVPFYPLFKTDPTPYYAVGIILYFLTSVCVFFFVKALTANKNISFAASVIFAAGYIGAESVYGITNSWQTSRGIMMALFAFWLFYKFARSKKIFFYILSVIMFFFSLDTVYVRAPGLIFVIFLFDVLFWPVVLRPKSVFMLFLRQLPFLFIHYHVYLSSLAYVETFGILRLFQSVFIDGKYQLLAILPQDIGNLFIPDTLTSIINTQVAKLIRLPEGFYIGSLLSSLMFFALSIFVILKSYKKDLFLTKVLIFSIIWLFFNFFVFYSRESGVTFRTTYRYFHYSLVGVGLFWATSLYLLFKNTKKIKFKKVYFLGIMIIVSVFVSLNIINEYKFNQKRSIPTRAFFSSFKDEIPKIPKDGVIYFNIANKNEIKNQFGSFFGGMFSEGSNFAINSPDTDYMKDFKFTYNFDDILSRLSSNQTTLDKVFTFYYGKNGLVNTTNQVRDLLNEDKILYIEPKNISSSTEFKIIGDTFTTQSQTSLQNGIYFGSDPEITITTQTPSYVPGKVSFNLMARPIPVNTPYQSRDTTSNIDPSIKTKLLNYLLSQSLYRKSAIATSASFWKQEIPSNVLDGRLDTHWRAHRGYWHEYSIRKLYKPEFFLIDLGREINIAAVKWTVYQKTMLPTHYKIFTSTDNSNWQEVKEVTKVLPLPESTVVNDTFKPIIARFIKVEIYKTYGNEGPAFREFEVVQAGYESLDQDLVEQIRKNPFANITDTPQLNQALNFVLQSAKLRFYWVSDADEKQDPTKYIELPLMVDGNFHEYNVNLLGSGINWVKFTLTGFNFPTQLNIQNFSIKYASLEDSKN